MFAILYGREDLKNDTICLKAFLQPGISEPVFHDDLVYKFEIMVRKPSFDDQLKTIIKHYKRVCYNRDIMRQSA